MASGTLSTRPQAEVGPVVGRYEEFIQKRLEHTRRQVRLVDAGSNLILLIAASLFFFLAVAVADQWVFAHGLNFFGRLLLWAVWLAVAGTFAWRFIVPSVLHRINPVFAAHAIEQGRPSLKNSLINFLLLRAHQEHVAPVVYRAMEHRAAADLAKVPVEHAVDHRRLIHLTYLLAAAVALFVLYLALSPKNPFVSAARVLFPWAGIQAPTRVHIEDVLPGDAVVFRGDSQTISAHVAGLRGSEEVALLVSTPDGQLVDDRVTMTRTGDDDRYACDLPTTQGGLQQDMLYRLIAGDATTQQYKLEAQDSPTIVVDRVDYHYPAYTGYRDSTIKGQGDIKAIEGTRVTIHATANMEIRDAQIDLGCAGLRTPPIAHAGTKATAELTLALDPENLSKPQYDQYQIRFRDVNGNEVRHPIRYRIDVDRDYPPEIEVVEPKSEETSVAVEGRLKIRVRASDDFGLRRVTLYAERGSDRLKTQDMLVRIPPEKAVSGSFRGEFEFVPAGLGLKAGDRVKYWLAADDNKEPKANHSETSSRTIKIVADEQEAQRDRQNQGQPQSDNREGEGKSQEGTGSGKPQPNQGGTSEDSHNGPQGDNASPKKEGDKSQDNSGGQHGEKSEQNKSDSGNNRDNASKSDQTGGQQSEPSSSEGDKQEKKPVDQGTQSADAIKQMLDDAKKQEQQQNKSQPSGDNPKQDQQQNNKQNDKQDGSQQGNPQQPGQEKSNSQGGQGSNPSQGASGQNASQNGNSGNTQPNGNQGNSSPNGASGQQPGANPSQQNSGAKEGAGQSPQPGSTKPSPQNDGNSQQPNGGSPNQERSGEKSGNEQSASQNAGGQENKQPNSSAGGEKGASNSGGANKPDAKPAGSKNGQENSAAGGSQTPKEKQAGGGQQGENQQPGGSNSSKAEKKPSGGASGDNQSQLAMNGPKNDKKEASSSGGGNSPITPSGGSKQENKPKSGGNQSSGGGQNQENKEKTQQSSGGGSGGEQKQQKNGGEQPSSGSGSKPSPGGTKSQEQGDMANGEPRQQDPGKSGNGQQDSSGAPDSQVDPTRAGDKAGNAHPNSNQSDPSKAPGNSPHKSDSESQTSGDRKGGGGEGGGQPDKKPGKGAAGNSMDAPNGGSVSPEKGSDATGDKAGEASRTTNNTASPHKESGNGSGEKPQSADQKTAENDAQPPQDNANSANDPGQQTSSGGPTGAASPQGAGHQGFGQPSGGNAANAPGTPPPSEQPQGTPDQPDLDFSKKQVDLALNHLKDEMKKQKPELLDKLGWSKEDAQKFYDNISKLRDAAQQPGGDAANKNAYNEFLKNLDLHPHGTRIGGNSTRKDDARNVLDAGQMPAPAGWEDITHEYLRSTAGEK